MFENVGEGVGGRESLTDLLGALADVVDRLAALGTSALDGPTAQMLAEEVGRANDRLAGLRLRALPVIEADGRWSLDGFRTFPQWVARHLGESVGQARRDVRLGRALRDELPATGDAVAAGGMSLEHARVLVTVGATSERRREVLAGDGECNEAFFVAQAAQLGVDPFRTVVRHWAAAADPESCDRGFKDAVAREFVELSRTMDGYHVAGFLTEEHGQVLTAALSAVVGVPAAGDDRSSGQRRAQGLADLARLVLDHGLVGAGAAVRPHLSVHLTLADLQALDDTAARAVRTGSGAPPLPRTGVVAESNRPSEPAERSQDPGQSERPGQVEQRVRAEPPDRAEPHERDEHDAQDELHDVEAQGEQDERSGDVVAPVDCARPDTARSGLSVPAWPGGVPVPVTGSAGTDAVGHTDAVGRTVAVPSASPALSPATFDDGTPVPATLLARLACDSEVSRIVFGPEGVVLDVGRSKRVVTGQLRRAVIARDRCCTYPDCQAPPAMSEVHHPHHWARGGKTCVENGCLLCWHHHDLVHRLDIAITWQDGAWVFTDRHGNPIRGTASREASSREASSREAA